MLSAPVEQSSSSTTTSTTTTPKSKEPHTVEAISPIGDHHYTHVAHIPIIPTHYIITETGGDSSSKSTTLDKTTAAPSTTTVKDAPTSSVTSKPEAIHKNIKRDAIEDKKTNADQKVNSHSTPAEQVRGQSKFGAPATTTATESAKVSKVEVKHDTPKLAEHPIVVKESSSDLHKDHISTAAATKEADKIQTSKHDQHKREATTVKGDSKKASPLSNPTIATPSALLKSDSKATDKVDAKKATSSSVDSKPIPTSSEKPAHDSVKHPKRETTKAAETKTADTKPEPIPSTPKISSDFHTSHHIPEHIQSHLRNDEGKFQTSHHIPTHSSAPAPVVVGVTPKKTEEATKTDSVATTEAAKKEQSKDEVKDTKPIGSRHRRDTKTTTVTTTGKPESPKKPADHLARVPLTKTETVEAVKKVETAKSSVETSKADEAGKTKQQNGHAAHSEADRIKRENKATPTSAETTKKTPEEHHGLVFPVPVGQIVKNSEAAPEIHQ